MQRSMSFLKIDAKLVFLMVVDTSPFIFSLSGSITGKFLALPKTTGKTAMMHCARDSIWYKVEK